MNDSVFDRYIVVSGDGSSTLFSKTFGESYHSSSGAIQESIHLFINNGLIRAIGTSDSYEIHIIEYGFGTGLNALLTLETLLKNDDLKNYQIYYTTIEKYPLIEEEYSKLNYSNKEYLTKLHQAKWHSPEEDSIKENFDKITEQFYLRKIEADFSDYYPSATAAETDVIYFDPFSPETQPQLWSEEIFSRIYNTLKENGILVTYSAKGIVKQALRKAGFQVQRIKGAGKKRHSLVAIKTPQDILNNQQ